MTPGRSYVGDNAGVSFTVSEHGSFLGTVFDGMISGDERALARYRSFPITHVATCNAALTSERHRGASHRPSPSPISFQLIDPQSNSSSGHVFSLPVSCCDLPCGTDRMHVLNRF